MMSYEMYLSRCVAFTESQRTHSDTLVTLHGNVCLGCSMLPAACMYGTRRCCWGSTRTKSSPASFQGPSHLDSGPLGCIRGDYGSDFGGVIIRSPSPTNIAVHGLVRATARLHGRDGESGAVGPQLAASLGHTWCSLGRP
jgi:hypothetical protein